MLETTAFRFNRASLAIGLALLATSSCTSGGDQRASADSAAYQWSESSSADGTGKFYMGREIASSSGHQDVSWMDRQNREAQELPGRVIRVMDLKPSHVVADIGTGTGYFALRISPHVPYGRVFAVDIDEAMVAIVREKAGEQNLENVVTVLGNERGPQLPPNSVDVVLIVDAYHEFTYPREMMYGIVESLREGGRLVLVEYRGEDETLPIAPIHRMTEAQARREIEAIGLRWRETLDVLPLQHILIFEKPTEE